MICYLQVGHRNMKIYLGVLLCPEKAKSIQFRRLRLLKES